MRLKQWQAEGGDLTELSNATGINRQTLAKVCRGLYLDKWSLAKRIQEHTDGAVTALECVEPDLETQRSALE